MGKHPRKEGTDAPIVMNENDDSMKEGDNNDTEENIFEYTFSPTAYPTPSPTISTLLKPPPTRPPTLPPSSSTSIPTSTSPTTKPTILSSITSDNGHTQLNQSTPVPPFYMTLSFDVEPSAIDPDVLKQTTERFLAEELEQNGGDNNLKNLSLSLTKYGQRLLRVSSTYKFEGTAFYDGSTPSSEELQAQIGEIFSTSNDEFIALLRSSGDESLSHVTGVSVNDTPGVHQDDVNDVADAPQPFPTTAVIAGTVSGAAVLILAFVLLVARNKREKNRDRVYWDDALEKNDKTCLEFQSDELSIDPPLEIFGVPSVISNSEGVETTNELNTRCVACITEPFGMNEKDPSGDPVGPHQDRYMLTLHIESLDIWLPLNKLWWLKT